MGAWCYVHCNCPNRNRLSPPNRDEYECGHQLGELVGLNPAGILDISRALREAFGPGHPEFEAFLKIGHSLQYDDEMLQLTSAQRDLWQMEIDQVRTYLADSPPMPWDARKRWDACWDRAVDLDDQSQITKRELFEEWYGDFSTVLDGAANLCRASVETGNPVVFLQ